MDRLEYLQDNVDATEDVLVVDFDKLSCVTAVLSNVSSWGARLTGKKIGDLHRNIGIRIGDSDRLVKARVMAVKGQDASIVFPQDEEKVSDKRRERRNSVSIPVTITDREGITEISGLIVDAGANGCRISAKGLTALPDEVMLKIKRFEKPVVGEFAWRNETSAGVRLLWNEGEMP
ncbi:hypothetical protein GCM10011316_05710 [Roseibium aquae]|uniref:PilZ domain-containing protein n=1 Tax=Roseibium aquae TaxID=1323746 RepID=A0A916T952_9HYPH|nr:PilZ domain-containing protein [Roseibium aquae]GGB36409.1 hypothetical protein GCM10011316_05710 [Roseibium aquae]